MAYKRTSRIHVSEGFRENDTHLPEMASAYLSRRSSRNSLKDDPTHAAQDLEEDQRKGTSNWEPPATSSRTHSLGSSSKDTIPPSMFDKSTAISMSSSSSSSSSSISDSADSSKPSTKGRPTNFGLVIPGVYRSSYPKPEDYDFLRSLGLKTVVTLVKKDELDHDLESFVTSNGINQVIFNMKGTKKEAIPIATMRSILSLVLDRKNHPLMIHCNHGKHRTGCVVGAIRKLSGWQLNAVLDEYTGYAEPKVRECDVDYIRTIQCGQLQGLYKLQGELDRRNPLQARSFFRLLLFSTFVMVLWLVSGSRMPLSHNNSEV